MAKMIPCVNSTHCGAMKAAVIAESYRLETPFNKFKPAAFCFSCFSANLIHWEVSGMDAAVWPAFSSQAPIL